MEKKTNTVLKDIGSGAAMGVAAAIPGVSGGTIAVMLGVYDRHLGHMDNLRKHLWTNLRALLPLLCGIIIGIIPAFILFDFAFKGFVFGIVSLFAGLIIGGMPSLFDEVKHTKIKPLNILILILTLGVALALGVISVHFGHAIDIAGNFNMDTMGHWVDGGSVSWWIYLVLIPMGIIASIALIVPGISGSMIMLVTGFYNPIIDTLHWWKAIFTGKGSWEMAGSLIGLYVCLFIGIVIGFVTIVRLLKFLLDKYRVASFYGIIGFVLGSLGSLYYNFEIVSYYQVWHGVTVEGITPWMPMGAEIGVGMALLVVGCAISYMMVRYQRRHNDIIENN